MSLPAGYWVLAAIGVLGELGPLTLGGGRRHRASVYMSICTSVAILLVWGVWPALAAQVVAALVAALRSRLDPVSAALLIARAAAAIGAAAVIVGVTELGSVRRSEGIDRSVLVDLILVILAWLVLYYVPVIAMDRWRQHEAWRTVLDRRLGAEVLGSASLLFLAPVVVAEPRGWTFALLALPVLALNQLGSLVARQAASLRYDQVTGLLNQRGLAIVADDLGRSRRTGKGRYTTFLVRLHNLRDLDDAFGRRIVDAVLAGLAGRLTASFGGEAAVGRSDTDDLVVLVRSPPGSTSRDPGQRNSPIMMINQAVDEPVVVDGLPYDATATIGIARCPEDADDFATLLRQADSAIRHSRAGRDRVAAYTPTSQSEIDRRLGLLTDLSAALSGHASGGTLEFVYQPQVRLDSGDVVAVEALLRWTHPRRGTVSPEDVVMVAAPTPLIHDLTRLGIETVISQLREWHDVDIDVAVNVSMRDLHQDWLIDEILDRVRHAGIVPHRMVIEVTETELIEDPDQVRRAAARLAAAGLQMSVDDFGSGYASLQHLRQLSLDQLKIDRSLIRTIADNAEDRAVVRSVIELARALDLSVVAEGVENEDVHRMLRELGCPMGQGWYYGRPVTGPQIVRTLETRSRR
jgi:diguanylate cyclase (GGDEF)-like protein